MAASSFGKNQVFQEFRSAPMQERIIAQNQKKLPLLPFLTHTPVPNVLEAMRPSERSAFFLSLLRRQQMEQLRQYIPTNRSIHLADALRLEEQKHLQNERRRIQTGQKEAQNRRKIPQNEEKRDESRQEGEKSGQEQIQDGWKGEMPILLLGKIARSKEHYAENPGAHSAGPNYSQVAIAHEQLCLVLDEYARGDDGRMQAAVSELEARLAASGYRADDLMATLLLIIEDQVWSGKEGRILSQTPFSSSPKILRIVPARMQTKAKASMEIRLASVREMLRHYFISHPNDYLLALCIALGISDEQQGDAEFLQERLASEIARIGCFAFAQKLLVSVKRLNGMDTKKCLLKLGFIFDRKSKRIILGKRTCGAPMEAAGIINLLMKGAKKSGG